MKLLMDTDGVTGKVACATSSLLLARIRATLGESAVDDVVRRSGIPYTVEHLTDDANWIPYADVTALFETAAQVAGDDDIARRVGEETVRRFAGTSVSTVLRSLGSPEAVFDQIAIAMTKFSTVSKLERVEVRPGRAVVRSITRPGYVRDRHMCALTRGTLSQPPCLFGLPPALVDHPQCELRGEGPCTYVATWDAALAAQAADPQVLVTALEQQISGMTERLESMYATARDLIGLDDLDTALQRITERAATTVQAPRHLLAVRAGDPEELHVHHRGYDLGEDVHAAALELLDDARATAGGRLVAPIASATRAYGTLMAVSPGGAFFPHEQDLLEIYAGYAAAVLDTHAALDAARRREEQAHVLLALAQALAAAPTVDVVAERLAQAVPAIVDCDRVVVYLWDDAERALFYRTSTDVTPEVAEQLRQVRVTAEQSPAMAAITADPRPEPQFFTADTEDPYLGPLLRRTGAQLCVVTPIVARGVFHGLLSSVVDDHPERLTPTPALLERLTGVTAQAATALDSAHRLEQMAHLASHDHLTGLLGHRAFHEALDALLRSERAGDWPFTVAAIDIDDFKRINDAHGHPIGDEALQRVADALRRGVRDGDTVFRVGGEEFMVLLPGLHAHDAVEVAERLRDAVACAPFELPLRVSVGLASWPADAHDRADLLARADAALYDAKRSGKDRVRVAV